MITKMTHTTEPLPQFNFSGRELKMHCTDCGETITVPSYDAALAKAFASKHLHNEVSA